MSCTSQNIAREKSIPHGLVSRLNQLFYDAFGGSQRKRLEPFLSFFTDDLMTTCEPGALEKATLFVPLAIVEFGKWNQKDWYVS